MILSYVDYPFYLGLSRRISGVSEVLMANNINVKVVAPRARSPVILSDSFSSNILVKRIDLRSFGFEAKKGSKLIQWILFSLLGSIEVIKDVIKNRPIVQFQSIYSAFPAFIAKIVMRATIVGDDIVLINPIVNKVTLKLADSISTPSLATYSYARQLGKPAFYVPNGVELNATDGQKKNKSKKNSSIIFVGALTFDQNFMAIKNIMEIATVLDAAGFDFNVLIVGGPLSLATEFTKNPIVKKGRVKFLGQLSFSELSSLYASSSIGLLPFFQDIPLKGGQRTKALEYLANGLLVMSGPEGVKGIHGLKGGEHFLAAKSLDEMIVVLKECLMHPEKFHSISCKGTAFVIEHHSWRVLTYGYLSFLKNLQC